MSLDWFRRPTRGDTTAILWKQKGQEGTGRGPEALQFPANAFPGPLADARRGTKNRHADRACPR